METLPLPVVFQVWIRRTSSCPPAQLCPAAVGLATVQPVRSRSSAVPAASRDPASRRSSDQPENNPPPPSSSSPTHHSLACQPARPHAALHFLLFLFPPPSSSAGEQVFLCFALRGNISKGKLEFCAA